MNYYPFIVYFCLFACSVKVMDETDFFFKYKIVIKMHQIIINVLK